MNKNKILVMIVAGVLIIIVGISLWLSLSGDNSDNFNVLPNLSGNDSPNKPLNANDAFTTVDDCEFVCTLVGYNQADCKNNKDASSDDYLLASCLIEGNNQCDKEGECSCYCWDKVEKEESDDPVAGLANPAAIFCKEQGGVLDIRGENGGFAGYCQFKDGTECEEWAYFNGTCTSDDVQVE